MADIIARGQITIVDVNDAKNLNMYLGANQPLAQHYSQDLKKYIPDWTASPYMVITPELFVSGTSSNVISQLKGAPTWKINGQAVSGFGGTAGTASPWALTLKQNMTGADQYKVTCEGVWVDPVTKMEVPVRAQLGLTKHNDPGMACWAVCTAPKGSVFKQGISELKAHCDFFKGNSVLQSGVTYLWKKLTDGEFVALTSANSGYTTNEVTIHAGDVLNQDTFCCECTHEGTVYKDYISFADMTDPYRLELFSTTGNCIKNGVGSTVINAEVWQKGEKLDNSAFNFAWTKYDASGAKASSWSKTGASITVAASEITNKATFVCELSLK